MIAASNEHWYKTLNFDCLFYVRGLGCQNSLVVVSS
jgi:hypothetical protein